MKKKIILITSVLLVALIGLNVLSNADFTKNNNNGYVEPSTPNTSTDNNKKPIYYYVPDWDTDIMTIPEYLAKNRDIKYGILSGNTVIYDVTLNSKQSCISTGGSALALMYDYFEALRQGDHEAVNAMYREDYFDGEEKKPYEDFPQQKIYDTFVRKYDHKDEAFENVENAEPTYYLVTYKIMENDGMFRDNVESDAEMVQLFGILTYADGTSEIYLLLDLPDYSLS